jgi:uncharacterized DUF497 family protein
MFEKIQEVIQDLDNKKQLQITIGTLVATALLLVFFAYRFERNISDLSSKMKALNKARKETKELLSRSEIIDQQRNKVEENLEKDKNFNLEEFLRKTLEEVKLLQNLEQPNVTINEIEGVRTSSYEEVRLDARLKNINMRQVTDLLSKIQQQERVYTKFVEIFRSASISPTVNLHIIIGTLQKKPEPSIS